MDLLEGKNILVMGVANDRSIAWAIAQSLASQGATIAFTYESERVEERVRKLADTLPNSILLPCNVTVDEEIETLAVALKERFGVLHGLVHSIAFAKSEELEGLYVRTSRAGYALAQEISAYSLVAVAQRIYPLMTEGGSIMTMTYLGAERVLKKLQCDGSGQSGPGSQYTLLGRRPRAVQHQSERHFRGPDPHTGGQRDQGFQHDPADCGREGSPAKDHGSVRGRGYGVVPHVLLVKGNHRRSDLCGQRLSYYWRVERFIGGKSLCSGIILVSRMQAACPKICHFNLTFFWVNRP